MKIKCLIIDDEDLALDILEEFIGRIDFLQLAGRCKNAVDALGFMNKTNVDLIFVDIQMPGLTGIQLLKNLSNAPSVIITTAYPNYAIEGFELNVLDYLLKPIAFERFFKSVNRFFSQNTKYAPVLKDNSEYVKAEEAFIFVRSDKQMVKIFLWDILYIESKRNYALINLADRTQIKTISTISNIESILSEKDFMRVHRSFIIAINKIHVFNAGSIHIADSHIPIGRNYTSYVLSQLNKKSIF